MKKVGIALMMCAVVLSNSTVNASGEKPDWGPIFFTSDQLQDLNKDNKIFLQKSEIDGYYCHIYLDQQTFKTEFKDVEAAVTHGWWTDVTARFKKVVTLGDDAYIGEYVFYYFNKKYPRPPHSPYKFEIYCGKIPIGAPASRQMKE